MSNNGIVLLPSDSEYFELFKKSFSEKLKVNNIWLSKKSDIQISKITRDKGRVFVEFRVFGEVFKHIQICKI